jgi:hypothetical protein
MTRNVLASGSIAATLLFAGWQADPAGAPALPPAHELSPPAASRQGFGIITLRAEAATALALDIARSHSPYGSH